MLEKTINKLVELLEDIGCCMPDDIIDKDIALYEYVPDSVTYMLFITSIEDYYGIEIPDEFLSYEYMKSFVGFTNAIISVIGEERNCE